MADRERTVEASAAVHVPLILVRSVPAMVNSLARRYWVRSARKVVSMPNHAVWNVGFNLIMFTFADISDSFDEHRS